MIETACEACGKIYRVKDELGGRNAKCGCGAVLMIPAAPVADSATSRAGTDGDKKPRTAPRPAPKHPIAPHVPQKKMGKSGSRKIAFIVVAVIAIALIAGAALTMLAMRPDRWETDNGPHLMSLRDLAQSHAKQDRFVDARSKYAELFDLLGDRKPAGELGKAIDAARAEYGQIKTRIEQQERAAADQAQQRAHTERTRHEQALAARRSEQEKQESSAKQLLQTWARARADISTAESQIKDLDRQLEAGVGARDAKLWADLTYQRLKAEDRKLAFEAKAQQLADEMDKLDLILIIVTSRQLAEDRREANDLRPIYAQWARMISKNVAEADIDAWLAARALPAP